MVLNYGKTEFGFNRFHLPDYKTVFQVVIRTMTEKIKFIYIKGNIRIFTDSEAAIKSAIILW